MTQLNKIREELLKNNKVSRNWCLSWFCTRLGAYIITLKREGFEFNPHNEGGDYVYEVVKRPENIAFVCSDKNISKSFKSLKNIENGDILVLDNKKVQSRLGFTLPPVRE